MDPIYSIREKKFEDIGEFDGENYVERTAKFTIKGAMHGLYFGAAYAALCDLKATPTNSLAKQTMRIIGTGALLIGSSAMLFAGVTGGCAIVRDKDDWKNWAVGGAAAGSMFGIRNRSWPIAIGIGASFAFGAGITKWSGVYKDPWVHHKYI